MGTACVSVWAWSSGRQDASPLSRRGGGPMARRTFDVVDVMEILTHWYAGRSKNQIAESLGLDRKTVRKYLAPAEAEGLAPGGLPVSSAEWRERAAGWFPELADARLRQVTRVHRVFQGAAPAD